MDKTSKDILEIAKGEFRITPVNESSKQHFEVLNKIAEMPMEYAEDLADKINRHKKFFGDDLDVKEMIVAWAKYKLKIPFEMYNLEVISKATICKECFKGYDRKDLKRSLGEFSSAVRGGFCSAQCYTKNVTKE